MINTPTVSVIIPCYNHGEYLKEAIASVEETPGPVAYEIIIVNDGSTDAHTLRILAQLRAEGYKVKDQQNGGPAAARNTGVREAAGKYLLLLDSDNKIRPQYLATGVAVLEASPGVGVVYGNAAFFGEQGQPRFSEASAFSLEKILLGNYIDACCMIRKSAWEAVGGMNENRVLIGHEDWELWIRMGAAGWEFHLVNQTLFDYRLRSNSVITEATKPEKMERMLDYVYARHIQLYGPLFRTKFAELERTQRKLQREKERYEALKNSFPLLLKQLVKTGLGNAFRR